MNVFGFKDEANFFPYFMFVRGIYLIFIPLGGEGYIVNAGGDVFGIEVII